MTALMTCPCKAACRLQLGPFTKLTVPTETSLPCAVAQAKPVQGVKSVDDSAILVSQPAIFVPGTAVLAVSTVRPGLLDSCIMTPLI